MVEERLAKAYLTLGHYLRNEINRLEDEYGALLLLIQSEHGDKVLDMLKEQIKEKSIEIGVYKRINAIINADQQTLLDIFDNKEKIKMDEV